MTTQSFYTPPKAAEMLACTEAEIIEYIKSGQLKAAFMANIANYVITHNDLMAFVKVTRNFKTMQKMLTRRVVIIDRDSRRPEVYRLVGTQYLAIAPSADGWVIAEVLGIRLQRRPDRDTLRLEALDERERWAEV